MFFGRLEAIHARLGFGEGGVDLDLRRLEAQSGSQRLLRFGIPFLRRQSQTERQQDRRAGRPHLPGLLQVLDRSHVVADLQTADVLLVYAAGGWMDTFDALGKQQKDMIFFCRHRSGPVYLWYEIISPRYLRQHTDKLAVDGVVEKSVASTLAPTSTTSSLGIGQRLGGWGGYMPFKGVIDSVVITLLQ